MGVTGLLQQLKDIQHQTSLSQYKGKTLAVDTYGWLHRGLISCAQDLCTNEPARGYVTSVMKKVDMVRHFGVEPLLVFDGAPLPTKEGTHMERRSRREKAREQAQLMLKKGDRKGAWKEFMKAAAVTPEMAKSVMVELERRHVRYVVAPYEADPQMVYLEKIGAVDGILSEDSDLLVFGCRRLLTKLNDYGECIEICRDDFSWVPRMALHTFTPSQWRLVAILAGCDYTKGVPGVGLKTAFGVVSRLGGIDKIVASFRAENRAVPEDFLAEAYKADLAFQYQKVFDPESGQVTTLCEISPGAELDMSALELCCGRSLEPEIHAGICRGKLHPYTHEVLISREHNLSVARSNSVNIMPTTKAAAAPTSQSFSSAKSITSYFKTESVKIPETTFSKPLLKRPVEKTLSPSSKKLRRFVTTKPGAATASKFFSSSPPSIPPVSVSLTHPQNDADFGFSAGDSEVPEDSSPIRGEHHNDGSVTDTDDDLGGSAGSMANSATCQSSTSLSTKIDSDDEGYDNEIDESPIKKESISLSWRKRFAMGGGNSPEKRPQVSIRAAHAVKVSVTATSDVVEKNPPSPSEADGTFDSLESSSGPHTPEEAPEGPEVADVHGLKSSQTFISESEEEFGVSPKRAANPAPPKSATSTLSRFAFTGR